MKLQTAVVERGFRLIKTRLSNRLLVATIDFLLRVKLLADKDLGAFDIPAAVVAFMASSRDGPPPILISKITKGVNDIEIANLQAGVACDEDKDEEPYGPDFVEEQEEVEVLPLEGEGSSEDESSEGEDDEDLPPHRNRIAPRGTAPVRALTEYEAMLANVGISE